MSNPQNTVDFLRRVPLFYGLSDRKLNKLAKRFVARGFASGDMIVAQGDGGEGLFIIVSGKAEAVRERVNGDKIVVSTFGPTSFFGELALLNEGTRTASVIAREDTECLVLARWDFLSVLKEDADMGVMVAQELARRFRRMLDTLF